MVKIGPVGEYEFKLNSQELVPENKTELNNIIKICLEKEYPFFVDFFDEPKQVKTAIGKVVFEVKWCVLIDKSVSMDVVELVEINRC